MHTINKLVNVRALLRALLMWFVAAVALLAVSAAVLNNVASGSRTLAYIASGISLTASMAATMYAVKNSEKDRMLTAIICAGFISVVLLLLGFVISRHGLSPDGVLSVVMFTFSGSLLGGFFAPVGSKKARKKGKRKVRKQS